MDGPGEMHPIPAMQSLLEMGASVGIEVQGGGLYEEDVVTIVALLKQPAFGKTVPLTIEVKGSEVSAVAEEVRVRLVRALTALEVPRVAGTPVRAV